MLPIRDVLPTRITPYATRAIVAANVIVFLLTLTNLESAARHFGAVPFHFTGLPPEQVTVPGPFGELHVVAAVPDDGTAWLRVFTHMFIHGGWFHLIANMWFLWIFGDNVEERLGRARYVLLYLVSGFASLATQIAASPTSGMPMVGASGAISGILGAYVIFYPRAEIITLIPIGFFPLLFSLSAKFFLIYWFALQFLSGVIAPSGEGVAWWAHVGGFVAGLLLAKPLAPRIPPWQRGRITVEVGGQ